MRTLLSIAVLIVRAYEPIPQQPSSHGQYQGSRCHDISQMGSWFARVGRERSRRPSRKAICHRAEPLMLARISCGTVICFFAGDARCFLHDKFSVPCYGIPRLTIGTSRPGLFQKEGRPKVIESELLRRIVPILVFGLREPTDLSCCTHKPLCVSNSAG